MDTHGRTSRCLIVVEVQPRNVRSRPVLGPQGLHEHVTPAIVRQLLGTDPVPCSSDTQALSCDADGSIYFEHDHGLGTAALVSRRV